MQDGIIKGTGNSRYLKSISNFLAQYPTYQDFVAALVAGTLPIDLNGINETGWDQLGTALNKANLLSDETCAAMGLPNTAVPDDALLKLGSIVVGGKVIQHTIVNQYTATEDNQSISIPLSGFSGSYSIDFRSTQSPELFDISLRDENNQLENQAQRTVISNYNNTVSSITRAIDETNACIPLFNFIVADGVNFSAIVHLLNMSYAYLQLWKSNRALFDSLLIVLKHTGDTVTIYKNNEVIP